MNFTTLISEHKHRKQRTQKPPYGFQRRLCERCLLLACAQPPFCRSWVYNVVDRQPKPQSSNALPHGVTRQNHHACMTNRKRGGTYLAMFSPLVQCAPCCCPCRGRNDEGRCGGTHAQGRDHTQNRAVGRHNVCAAKRQDGPTEKLLDNNDAGEIDYEARICRGEKGEQNVYNSNN